MAGMPRSGGLAGASTGRGGPLLAGRWSRTPDRDTDPTRRAVAAADVLLDRYGVVVRGSVVAERHPGGFSSVYPVLSAAEESGRARRGYFVEGLGASQFATVGAVDRLRAMADRPDRAATRAAEPALVLAATDPANPYGAALEWPSANTPADSPARVDLSEAGRAEVEPPIAAARRGRGHQPARKAGALVVLVDGECVLYVERGGKTLLSFHDDPERLQAAADALALAVREGLLGKLQIEKADGEPVGSSALTDALEAAGFRPTPRGLRLRAGV